MRLLVRKQIIVRGTSVLGCQRGAVERQLSAYRKLSSTTSNRKHFTQFNRLEAILQGTTKSEISTQLHSKGYCVIDNAFDKPLLAKLRSQINQLHDEEELYLNHTHVISQADQSSVKLIEKKRIYETELAYDTVRSRVPDLSVFHSSDTLRSSLNEIVPSLLATHQMIKIQFNEGVDGCFPMHYDSYGEDGKSLTAILYLNENWKPSHGGELRLYPFPYDPIDIAPIEGRIAIFSSRQMLHRVLPSSSPRYCLTTWLYSAPDSSVPTIPKGAIKRDSTPFHTLLRKFTNSSFRRHLSKLYYADEWRNSIEESHVHNSDLKAFISEFDREVKVIESSAENYLTRLLPENSSSSHLLIHDLLSTLRTKSNSLPDNLVQWF